MGPAFHCEDNSRSYGDSQRGADLRLIDLPAIAAKAGVTRIADLTGLDRIDIPVAQAVRPMGKSLSTNMGKGIDFEAASIGAMMEAIEVYCAEELPTCGIGAKWLEATDLVSGKPGKVSWNSVSLDYTRPDHKLQAESNGLASGRTTAEALRAALCELIERDRWAKWLSLHPQQKSQARICLETVEDKICRTIFAKIHDAGCQLLLWELSAVDHLPVYAAAILDGQQFCELPPTFGTAARRDPAAAVIAAVGEAAQTRAAIIAGTRDDRGMESYKSQDNAHGRVLLETFGFLPAERHFADTAVTGHGNAESDVEWLIEKLTADGVGELLWVDLTRKELGVPVVKVIAPGLKGFSNDITAWQRSQ